MARSAASDIWAGKTWSSNSQPSSASVARLRRKVASFIRSGASAKRNSGRSCQWSCSRVPRTSGVSAAWRRRTSAAPAVEEVGAADDGGGPAGLGVDVAQPGDLVQGAAERPVGLDVDRRGDAAGRGFREVFGDGIVAADRLVRAEDARDHLPLQPGQVGGAPDVVVRVHDSGAVVGRIGHRAAPMGCGVQCLAAVRRGPDRTAGRSRTSASAVARSRTPPRWSRLGSWADMARVAGR